MKKALGYFAETIYVYMCVYFPDHNVKVAALGYFHLLCIQSPSVQFLDCKTRPSQSLPPFFGAGAVHSLLRQWVHSVPHVDHLLHAVHLPSTVIKCKDKMVRGEGSDAGKDQRWAYYVQLQNMWMAKHMINQILCSFKISVGQMQNSLFQLGRGKMASI